ncbi:hypothetical protein ABTY20_00755 [Streptomyces sp. NPDC126497]|uniref:hypothetical protein n=1 Tax=Streptomyces sp. NPDC126497 TaxID=3155313 RepID=UPI0033263156
MNAHECEVERGPGGPAHRAGDAVTGPGIEIIGREVLRIDATAEREAHRMGKEWRKRTETRRAALVWALHVLLTGDPAQPPGDAVERFLKSLGGGAGARAGGPGSAAAPCGR